MSDHTRVPGVATGSDVSSPDADLDPEHPLKGALSWRDWGPVGIAAVVALLLGGGLLVVFGRVSPYDRPEVFNELANAV